jgi:hypothetical protein
METGDLVIRYLTETEKKKRGLYARKKEDTFDGAWKILSIHHEVEKSVKRIRALIV